MKKIKSRDDLILNSIAYIFLGILTLYCFIPFLMLLSSSITSEGVVIREGFKLIPKNISFNAYSIIFQNPIVIMKAYSITIFITVFGTAISLLCCSMFAYVLYKKDFKYRNIFAFYVYFTTLFSGGMVSSYILIVRYLHLKNSILILILHGLVGVFNILILRNFITGSVPDSLPESAKIDGAGDGIIFFNIVLPLMKPALASIGLFIALQYWNDWSTARLYINKSNLYPLQYVLYQLLASVNFTSMAPDMPVIDVPKETMKLSMTVVAIGPIVMLYPFVQKFFVKGITIGAVKG